MFPLVYVSSSHRDTLTDDEKNLTFCGSMASLKVKIRKEINFSIKINMVVRMFLSLVIM